MFKHGYTYSGHPTVAAAALANLDIMEREGLSERVLALEPRLVEMMESLTDHPLVAGYRGGIGLLGAVVLEAERLQADPEFGMEVYRAIRSRGLISRFIGSDSLQISPPLVISDSELDEVATLIRQGLDDAA